MATVTVPIDVEYEDISEFMEEHEVVVESKAEKEGRSKFDVAASLAAAQIAMEKYDVSNVKTKVVGE